MIRGERGVALDPLDELQLALDVDAVPHHPLDERLHGYQRRGVGHLHAHPKAMLLLIPGLGKTAITLSSLTSVHLPALVIAPKRVAEETWPEEIETWRPDLTYSLVRGSAPKRQDALAADADIYIISRDTFATDINTKLAEHPYKTVVIDEMSGFKSQSSSRWKNAKRLVKNTPYVYGLTGTPTPNNLMDLWPQMYLIDKGARLERTMTAYRSLYFLPGKRLPNGIITNWTLRPNAERVIWSRVQDVCMSVDPNEAKYPERIDSYHVFDMPPLAMEKYYQMRDLFVAEVAGHKASVEHAAAKTSKLSQIASGFMYQSGLIGVDEDEKAETQHIHQEKMKLVRDILDEAQGAPALIFYRYDEDRRRLLQLEGAVDIRTPNAIDRWNKGNIPVLIAHPASAGHGLNLQKGGSLMIWYGLTWSSEEYVQGIGRLVRQGQPSPAVAVHHLLARDTVDEVMLDTVQGKISKQDALLKVMEKK